LLGCVRDGVGIGMYINKMINILSSSCDVPLTGLLVGVGEGVLIEHFHMFLNIKRLYLVDPFEPFLEKWYTRSLHMENCFVKYYPVAMKKIEKYRDTCVFIKKFAKDAIDDIPDNLDFIWLDFCGVYDTFLEVCDLYFDKIKAGGLLAGKRHTYKWEDVVRALRDFCKDRNVVLNLGVGEHVGDWWIVKDG